MDVTDLASLPPWVQVLVYAGVFVGSAVVAILGYSKRRWAAKLGEQQTQDTVVVSAAFADSKPILVLTEAVNRLNENTEESHELIRSHTNSMNYLTTALREMTIELIRK